MSDETDPTLRLQWCAVHNKPIEVDSAANTVILDGETFPIDQETAFRRKNVANQFYSLGALALFCQKRNEPIGAYLRESSNLQPWMRVDISDTSALKRFFKAKRTLSTSIKVV
eukprot:GABV01010148.1.p3 GENE.GABV01010148.1~~GABV01010148.1.p3  ORF type:complete len:113 (-),score=40.26 GABV01010148.1:190-528(-)